MRNSKVTYLFHQVQHYGSGMQGVGTLHRGCSCVVFDCDQSAVRAPPGIKISEQELERMEGLHRWYASISGKLASSFLFS